MADDWNAKIIEEFRANAGVVGGPFDNAPLVLVHSVGRKSGAARINPMMYADWYYNLTADNAASVEVGTQKWGVTVEELTGDIRDVVYGRQAAAYRRVRRVRREGQGHPDHPGAGPHPQGLTAPAVAARPAPKALLIAAGSPSPQPD